MAVPPQPPLVPFNTVPKVVVDKEGRLTPEMVRWLLAIINQTEFFANIIYEQAFIVDALYAYRYPIKTVSSDYIATVADYYLLGDTSGGNFTIILPSAAYSGKPFYIKNIGGGVLTITGNIDMGLTGGGASITLAEAEKVLVVPNGTSYYKMG